MLLSAATVALALPAATLADFGFEPGSLRVTALNRDGSPDLRASTHPYELSVSFNLNLGSDNLTEGGQMRDVITSLPPGFVGDPTAIPSCPRKDLEGNTPKCPGDTQVGVVRAVVAGVAAQTAVYNVTPPPGQAARLGFSLFKVNIFQDASVNSEHGYSVDIGTNDIALETTSVTETVWGVPPDPGHDPERECVKSAEEGGQILGCASSVSPGVFLTQPATCQSPQNFTFSIDSALAPGAFIEETVSPLDGGGNPTLLTGCETVPFAPSVSAAPTTSHASSPAGLDFKLGLPDQGLTSPEGTAETEPEKTEVTLPAGVTVNPAAAGGLGACTPAQYRAATAGSGPGSGCPESSKIGTLVAKSPLLEEPIEGSVYLAAPHDNPFDSLLALYIVAKAPERGVLIKQAGEVQANPVTGQLTTTFAGLPPLPYSSFEFDLREGQRAPLITPQLCGTYATTVKLYPFSAPNAPVQRTAPFTISAGANGGACVATESQLPNAPALQAGTVTPLAGTFSSFVFGLSREDGSQRLGSVTASLPEGLLGDLAGVAYCSDAQIAAAAARAGEGEGAAEAASPSCPQASQVGVANITAGAGGEPYAVQGKAYLAGPYRDAPLSLAIVTPALAGPFDLGTVVVRVALYVDPNTAQISAVSDPLPTILDGIPLDLRSVSLEVNRSGFMRNPTSCDALTIGGQSISTLGQVAGLSNRFQVGGCQGLGFKPSLTAATAGRASRAGGASLTVKVAQKAGEANVHKVELTIPKALPARLSTLKLACTAAQFNSNPAACPAGSFIGTATANTPVLGVPLTGPAILVSHGGAAFPDVVFLLQADERGSLIRIDLDGKTEIKNGVTYSRFETVPDAPVTSFQASFPQGPHSIFGANVPQSAHYSLCGQSLTIATTITGQNGAQSTAATPVGVTGCTPQITLAAHSVKGRTATLHVRVPSAGRLRAAGRGLTAAGVTTAGAATVTVKLSLTTKEAAALKGRRLKTKVNLTFTPAKGGQLKAGATVTIG